jgi:hypothetical protein
MTKPKCKPISDKANEIARRANKLPRTAQRKLARFAEAAADISPIRHQPGKGLTISTEARFPAAIGDKLICAKSVIQAVRAAHDTQALDGENYDMSWPLSLAIDLLEQASAQLGKATVREVQS